MRLSALVALGALAVPAANAAHPNERLEIRANLDGDRSLERVVGVANVSSGHTYWRADVTVVDRCAKRTRTYVVVAGYPRLLAASAVQVDGRGSNEVVGVLRGHDWRTGVARVARLQGRAGRCPTLKTLFRYVAEQAGSAPLPELRLTQFGVEIVELAPEHEGRELRLVEYFRIPQMLSSTIRETLHRYDRETDRYVVYATNTYRVP